MATYCVTSVHVNAQGRILRARIQRADGATNKWIGQPGDIEAHELANLIASGDVVYSLFDVSGGTVTGPKFKMAVYDHGVEGIELETDVEGRRIQDLPHF